MGYFDDHFGANDGDGYFEDHFDAGTASAPGSANGGSSKARILGTLAPRPQVPPWRQVKDIQGASAMLTEMRRYMNDLNDRDVTFGNHIEVTFADDTTPVRVDTGLGGPPKGYKTVGANGDVRVYTATPPEGVDPTPERGVIWLKAAFDTATLPSGVTSAVVQLYVY